MTFLNLGSGLHTVGKHWPELVLISLLSSKICSICCILQCLILHCDCILYLRNGVQVLPQIYSYLFQVLDRLFIFTLDLKYQGSSCLLGLSYSLQDFYFDATTTITTRQSKLVYYVDSPWIDKFTFAGPLFTCQWNLFAQNSDLSSHLFGTLRGGNFRSNLFQEDSIHCIGPLFRLETPNVSKHTQTELKIPSSLVVRYIR